MLGERDFVDDTNELDLDRLAINFQMSVGIARVKCPACFAQRQRGEGVRRAAAGIQVEAVKCSAI